MSLVTSGIELGAKLSERLAPTLAKETEDNALNLIDIIGQKVLPTQLWNDTKAVALRLGVMPAHVARLARDGDLEAFKMEGRWQINPYDVESRLSGMAEGHATGYAKAISRPFDGRSRALGYDSFRRWLGDRQTTVSEKLGLTPAGVAKEWEVPKTLQSGR